MTHPDLERVTKKSNRTSWARRHRKGIEQLYFWSFLIAFSALQAFALHLAAQAFSKDVDGQVAQVAVKQAKDPQNANLSLPMAPEGQTARVTWFSSTECHTAWCKANAVKPRRNLAAINAKFGNVTKVYVPAFDKTYSTVDPDTGKIIRTDANTDLDIWCEGSTDCQQQVSARTFLINLIK